MKQKIIIAILVGLVVAFFALYYESAFIADPPPGKAPPGGGGTASIVGPSEAKALGEDSKKSRSSYGIAQWYPWLREFCPPPTESEKVQYLKMKNRSVEALVCLAMLDFPHDEELLKEAREKDPHHPFCLYLQALDKNLGIKERVAASLEISSKYPNDKMLQVWSASLLISEGNVDGALRQIAALPPSNQANESFGSQIKGELNDVLTDLGRSSLQSQIRTHYQSRSLVSRPISQTISQAVAKAQNSHEMVSKKELGAMIFIAQQHDVSVTAEDIIGSTNNEMMLIEVAEKLGYADLYNIDIASAKTQIMAGARPIIEEQHFFDLTPDTIEKMDDLTKEKFFRRVDQFGETDAVKWFRSSNSE